MRANARPGEVAFEPGHTIGMPKIPSFTLRWFLLLLVLLVGRRLFALAAFDRCLRLAIVGRLQ